MAFSQEVQKVIGYLSSDTPTLGDEVFLGVPVLDEFGEPELDDFDVIVREGGFFAENYPDYELRFLGQCRHPEFLSCEDLGIDADDGFYAMFWVAESIGSGNVDGLIETSVPVIINEQFAYDNWGLTGPNTNHGSPGTENETGVLDGGSHIGLDIEIVNDQHPIAKGANLANGIVEVYAPDGALIWGTVADSADVVATIPDFEEFNPAAAIFVYEQGDELANGEEAAGMRIGGFLSDIATGSTAANEAELLTSDGLALLKSAVDFALGIEPIVNECVSGNGDFDASGKVDFADFLVLSANFGKDANAANGDIDCSGSVQFPDFLVLSANFGQDVAAVAAAVPEPQGFLLCAMGMITLGCTRSHRRREA